MSNQSRNVSIRALEGQPGSEYDEETFLHLLTIERARAARKHQRVWLLLATLEPASGLAVPIPPASASRLFQGLRLLLRDTDITGWYRQTQVIGAVLCASTDAAGFEAPDVIEERIGEGLRRCLPSKAARSLRVRVTPQGPRRVDR
jgi:hypothetical protein